MSSGRVGPGRWFPLREGHVRGFGGQEGPQLGLWSTSGVRSSRVEAETGRKRSTAGVIDRLGLVEQNNQQQLQVGLKRFLSGLVGGFINGFTESERM